MTDPLDRLSALRSGTVPPLPGAAAARARGRQRTRRTRVALTGAAAVLAVVSVSAVSALAGGTGDRTVPPVASAAPQPETPLQAALLDADDVSAALEQEWVVRGTEDLPFVVELPVCTFSDVVGEQALRFFTGPDGEVLGTRVEVFADAGAARQHHGEVLERLSLCGPDQVAVEPPSGPADSVRGQVTDVYGTRDFAFSLVDRAVVLLMADGTAVEPELVDRADTEVRAAFPATAPEPSAAPSPSAGRTFEPASAFLSPEDAGAAEEGGWSVVAGAPGEEPLLDPCASGEPQQVQDVLEVSERAMSSEREAGGSSLEQEVYEYRDAGAAGRALAGYAADYERCSSSPSGESSYELVPVDGERLLVRQTSCPADCGAPYASYAFVVRSGFALTVARYGVGEDGDPADRARRLLDAVSAQLSRAVSDAEPPVYFRSPGGISCGLLATQVACDTTTTFEPPPRPADCEFDWGGHIALEADGARFLCASDTSFTETAQVLAYGQEIGNESFVCSSSTEGIRCRQRDGDAGFLLSRDRYELS